MKVLLLAMTKLSAVIFIATSVLACAGYSSDFSSSSEIVSAAQNEIADSKADGSQDTQCSDYVAKVLRRTGVNVPAFRANDFDKIMAKYLPSWKMTEFTTDDLQAGRAALRDYLNSYPDHTAFLAQWPRVGQSGHVAIVDKVGENNFVIYQAQAGLSLPGSKQTKPESLLYGSSGVDRSRLRLWTE